MTSPQPKLKDFKVYEIFNEETGYPELRIKRYDQFTGAYLGEFSYTWRVLPYIPVDKEDAYRYIRNYEDFEREQTA